MLINNHMYLTNTKLVVTVRNRFVTMCNQEIVSNSHISHVKLNSQERTISLGHREHIELPEEDYDALSGFLQSHCAMK